MTQEAAASAPERRTYADVWKVLSNVDCSDYTEVKQMGQARLTYLSWAWAWQQMMTRYADLVVEWMFDHKGAATGVRYADDGSAMVHCNVKIPIVENDPASGYLEREMWLPVMDRQGKGQKNPDTRQISDTKMRCMVKAFALFGLGHYIYAGEDLPNDPAKEREIDARVERLKALTVTLKEELGGQIPRDVLASGRDAINDRDEDRLKALIEDVGYRIASARQKKAEVQITRMDPDEEENTGE